ncbi:MAG: polysaccharide deacetylase family protein [Acidimicrobiales bacterium]|nr:polysaccharide deacetylase family protein [Acidimicrobiales bacterium]
MSANADPAPVADPALDPPPITMTVDVEDHRPAPTWEARYERCTRRFLDFFEEHDIRATFFVVGRLAEWSPGLVEEISRRGHEVGLHGYRHWAVFSYEPSSFAAETAKGKALIEDIIGAPVVGFRAPAGTIMPSTFWATEILAEVGFEYSASVLPAQSYVVGFPGVPATPFRWPSGLVEAPCPAFAVGSVGLPFMGGTFLRVFPLPLVRFLVGRLPARSTPWMYAHPYDIDTGEPFWVVPEVKRWGSVLLWTNRAGMLRKLERLLVGRSGPPLGERLRALAGDLPTFVPQRADEPPGRGDVVEMLHVALRRERIVRDVSPRNGEVTVASRGTDAPPSRPS